MPSIVACVDCRTRVASVGRRVAVGEMAAGHTLATGDATITFAHREKAAWKPTRVDRVGKFTLWHRSRLLPMVLKFDITGGPRPSCL